MDRDNLERFVQAQDGVLASVRAELAAGRKRSHWMWFVFPQLRGLGRSETARHYGLADLDEARAYWRHPRLGPSLAECVDLLLALPAGRTMHEVFGSPDDLKLRSCLTLFEAAAPEEPRFARALERCFGGQRDALTLSLIRPCGPA
jgi:uncharacterized protein (DUF1810 family)